METSKANLGTATSAACVLVDGKPVVVPNAEGSLSTPSVVAVAGDGEVLVGEAAKRQGAVNPGHTVRSVKRQTGDGQMVRIGTQPFTAPQLSALLLRRLRRDAEVYTGDEVTDAVITVPVSFDEAQRQAVRAAGQIAGLNVLRVLNESSAVGLAHVLGTGGREQSVLLVRMGAGTFEVSLMDVGIDADGDLVVEVKGCGGDDRLGGADWDRALVAHLAGWFADAHGVEVGDEAAMQRLREAAEQTKIDLSSCEAATVQVPFLPTGAQGPLHLEHSLSRARFQQLTSDLLDRCRTLIHRVIDEAGVLAHHINDVVLAGGATRMPAVVDLVRALVGGKEPRRAVRTDEAAAVGAALMAGLLTRSGPGFLLMEVTTRSVGIEIAGGAMATLVRRNTTIPTRGSEMFTTADDVPDGEGRSIAFGVYQGEHPAVMLNERLGTVELTGPPSTRRGAPRIEVTAEVDADGRVQVFSTDLATGRTAWMSRERMSCDRVPLVPLKPVAEADKKSAAYASEHKHHSRSALAPAMRFDRKDLPGALQAEGWVIGLCFALGWLFTIGGLMSWLDPDRWQVGRILFVPAILVWGGAYLWGKNWRVRAYAHLRKKSDNA